MKSKDKMIKITNFTIKKLFGYMTVSIPIVDNRIVIVGVNGTGKTTILTMLFYIMTSEWTKLLDFDFEEISLEIDGKNYNIIKKNLKAKLTKAEKKASIIFRRVPSLPKDYSTFIENKLHNDFIEDENTTNIKENIKELGKIYFLPTFRRIEKDLKDVVEFSNKEERFINSNSRREFDFKYSSGLINFGMEDVSERINNSLNNLKNISREKFRDLLGNHFKEMLNFNDSNSEELLENIKKYKDDDIKRILNRIIEDERFSSQDKISLIDSIVNLKNKSLSKVEINEKISAKFFLNITDIDKELTEKEKDIYNFATICTKYLSASGKEVKYDNQNYTFEILSENKHKVELKALSSGEKQILSIFSDLYLGQYDNFVFIIDEPELSLSVEWQKTFLPDILATRKCGFLMAVTHSPFIFENELDPYSRDMQDLCLVK